MTNSPDLQTRTACALKTFLNGFHLVQVAERSFPLPQDGRCQLTKRQRSPPMGGSQTPLLAYSFRIILYVHTYTAYQNIAEPRAASALAQLNTWRVHCNVDRQYNPVGNLATVLCHQPQSSLRDRRRSDMTASQAPAW